MEPPPSEPSASVDAVAVSADVAHGDLGGRTRLLDEAAARGYVPHRGLPMLAGQVDLILEFLGLSGHQPG